MGKNTRKKGSSSPSANSKNKETSSPKIASAAPVNGVSMAAPAGTDSTAMGMGASIVTDFIVTGKEASVVAGSSFSVADSSELPLKLPVLNSSSEQVGDATAIAADSSPTMVAAAVPASVSINRRVLAEAQRIKPTGKSVSFADNVQILAAGNQLRSNSTGQSSVNSGSVGSETSTAANLGNTQLLDKENQVQNNSTSPNSGNFGFVGTESSMASNLKNSQGH